MKIPKLMHYDITEKKQHLMSLTTFDRQVTSSLLVTDEDPQQFRPFHFIYSTKLKWRHVLY